MFSFIRLFLSLIFFTSAALIGAERGSSAPYISGDTFRAHCRFVYDELDRSFSPFAVQEGDTIFVKTDYLREFFEQVHPNIPSPYILLSHNSDYPIPGSFGHHLDDEKILAWFGQNVDNFSHPKLHPLPIGLANRCWDHGNVEIVKQEEKGVPKAQKNIFLYLNFTVGTCPDERGKVAAMFRDQPYCTYSRPKDYRSYLQELTRSKFVLSPRGNGLDCHRTWEALLMGAIPIVKSSCIDSLFEGLPVVIVNDWQEVTEPFLQAKYAELKEKSFQKEKLYIAYWLTLIAEGVW